MTQAVDRGSRLQDCWHLSRAFSVLRAVPCTVGGLAASWLTLGQDRREGPQGPSGCLSPVARRVEQEAFLDVLSLSIQWPIDPSLSPIHPEGNAVREPGTLLRPAHVLGLLACAGGRLWGTGRLLLWEGVRAAALLTLGWVCRVSPDSAFLPLGIRGWLEAADPCEVPGPSTNEH